MRIMSGNGRSLAILATLLYPMTLFAARGRELAQEEKQTRTERKQGRTTQRARTRELVFKEPGTQGVQQDEVARGFVRKAPVKQETRKQETRKQETRQQAQRTRKSTRRATQHEATTEVIRPNLVAQFRNRQFTFTQRRGATQVTERTAQAEAVETGTATQRDVYRSQFIDQNQVLHVLRNMSLQDLHYLQQIPQNSVIQCGGVVPAHHLISGKIPNTNAREALRGWVRGGGDWKQAVDEAIRERA